MHVEQSSQALQAFQMNKAFQEIDIRTSEIGNQMADFRIVVELGRGSYGTVYKVQSLKNNQTVVLKKISIKHMKPKQQQAALKEVQILKFLDHPHIIKYHTSFMEDESIHIVMEYAEKGDLYKLLKDQRARRKYFSEKDIWDFSYQICMAVEYLHAKNIIHRDIKCLNIFLTDDKRIKIGDLGVSKIVSNASALQDTRVGTPLYLSPELVKQQPYDFKVDVWAVGCAIYHLACLEPPFQGDNLITLGNNIVNKKHKQLPQIYSNKLTNFIDKFLAKKASDRPTARESVVMIPSFVKNAYQENIQRRNIFGSLTDTTPQSQSQLQQPNHQDQPQKLNSSPEKSHKSVSPTKDFRMPMRKQIEEQSVLVRKHNIDTQNIKVDNNIPLLQVQRQAVQQEQLKGRNILAHYQNKEIADAMNKDRISSTKQGQSEFIVGSRLENRLSENLLGNGKVEASKDQTPTNINNIHQLVLIKSQSQERIHTPKLQTQSGLQNRNSQLNLNSQQEGGWPLRQNNKFTSIDDHRIPLRTNSQKFTNQISNSQVALQSTNEETQKVPQSRVSAVQFKIDNQIIQSDGDDMGVFHNAQQQPSHSDRITQQQVDRGIFKGEVDLVKQQKDNLQSQNKQQRILQQLGKEMPFQARPQTASASNNNFIRRATQQQSSQASITVKPGISMLRNLASKNSQDNIMQQINQQNQANRPFSAAVPIIQGISQIRKKNVMFEDDLKDEQSELEILNDDEANENDYVQFNSNQQVVQTGDKLNSQAPPIFKNVYQSNQPKINFSKRPTTAVTQQSRCSSIQILKASQEQNVRQSFDSNSQQIPSLEMKEKRVVAQSIDSKDQYNKIHQSGNQILGKDQLDQSKMKNLLNCYSQNEYENQVSKFFKNNLKRQSAHLPQSSQLLLQHPRSVHNGGISSSQVSMTSHQSQIINNNDLKDLIKNYQPSSAQSLISQSRKLDTHDHQQLNQPISNNAFNLFKSIDNSSNSNSAQNKNLAVQQQKLVSLVKQNQPPQIVSSNDYITKQQQYDSVASSPSAHVLLAERNYVGNNVSQQEKGLQNMAEIQSRKYQQQNSRMRMQKKITIRDLEKPPKPLYSQTQSQNSIQASLKV